MSPSDKWQWCIHKIIVQQAVARTTKMLITKGLWKPSVVPDKDGMNNKDKNNIDTPQKHKRDDTNTNVIPSTNNNSTTNSSINKNNRLDKPKQLQGKDKKTQKVLESMDYFRIQPLRFTRFINVPIMCRRHHDNNTNNNNTAPSLKSTNSIEKHDVTSYIFRTPSIPRRFVLDKRKRWVYQRGPYMHN